MDVEQIFESAFNRLPSVKTWVLAYSGGLDSTVLFHLLHTRRKTVTLIPVHVHHALQVVADDWVIHCQNVAHHWGYVCQIQYVDARPQPGESPEAAARAARYQAFQPYLTADTALMLAHHADDQAETVLLQMMRGAGLGGLSAMPLSIKRGNAYFCRPLLNISKADLLNYAMTHGLSWVEDQTNADALADRNYIRHEIMPLLSARWPAARECLGRVATHAAEANALIEDYIALDLKAAKTVGYGGETVLNALYLQQLPESRAKQVIRLWLKEKNLRLPSMKKLQALMNTLISSRYDAMPVIRWSGVEIRRFKHHIYAYAPKIAHDVAWSASWMPDADLILPDDLGILKALDYQVLSKGEALHIRFRQGGEVIRAVHHQGHTALKDLMQTWGIPPWERTRIPLIFKNNVLIAVHGYTHETAVCDLNKE